MTVKSLIRHAVRRLGFDVRRFRPGSSDDASLVAMLSTHKVNLVLDVGANTGQFGQMLRVAGYRGRIVSFEPLSAAREQLAAAARNDSQWEVAPQMAIGSESGQIEIHIAGNSVSSSVLPMLESHAKAAPASVYVGSETVPLRTLDVAAAEYLRPDTVLFLKIDTQGYEDKVLQGSAAVLRRATGLQLELSLVPLYEGQRQYEEMIAHLQTEGFDLWNITPAFVDPVSGRLLQIDGTFFRQQA